MLYDVCDCYNSIDESYLDSSNSFNLCLLVMSSTSMLDNCWAWILVNIFLIDVILTSKTKGSPLTFSLRLGLFHISPFVHSNIISFISFMCVATFASIRCGSSIPLWVSFSVFLRASTSFRLTSL